MSVMASQITSLTIVYSTVHSGVDQRNIKDPCHWPFEGNLPVTGEFPAQRANSAENVSIWWRHHVLQRRLASLHRWTMIAFWHRMRYFLHAQGQTCLLWNNKPLPQDYSAFTIERFRKTIQLLRTTGTDNFFLSKNNSFLATHELPSTSINWQSIGWYRLS